MSSGTKEAGPRGGPRSPAPVVIAVASEAKGGVAVERRVTLHLPPRADVKVSDR